MNAAKHLGLQAKCPVLSDFNQNWNSLANISKPPQYQYHKSSFSGSRVDTCKYADGQTNTFLQLRDQTAIRFMDGYSTTNYDTKSVICLVGLRNTTNIIPSEMMIMSIWWDYVSEMRRPSGLLFIPRRYMRVESHGGMTLAGKTYSSTRALWQSYQQSPSSKEGELGEWNNLALQIIFVHSSKGFLTFRKILQGADGFTAPPKEGVLRIFIAFKNRSPWAGIEPPNLCSNGKHASLYTTEDKYLPRFEQGVYRIRSRIINHPHSQYWGQGVYFRWRVGEGGKVTHRELITPRRVTHCRNQSRQMERAVRSQFVAPSSLTCTDSTRFGNRQVIGHNNRVSSFWTSVLQSALKLTVL
jgi:hypothetical protein